MKHIFYVHSGITYLVSLGTIRYLRLQDDQVAFICARNFAVNPVFESLILGEKENELALLPSYGSRAVWTDRNILRALDKKVTQLAGGSFTLYLPTDRNYLMQFLRSHKCCIKRNFIEEGLLTYHDTMEKSVQPVRNVFIQVLKHLIRAPFHRFRTNVSPFKRKNEPEPVIYVATEAATSALSHRQTVLVDINAVMTSSTQAEIVNLLVLDPVVEMGLSDREIYFNCLDTFVSSSLPRDEMVHIKFHPRQTDFARYYEIFQKYKLSYAVLPPTTILEELLSSNRSIHVFGLSSSSLFYAQEWGVSVTSFSRQLAHCDAVYRNYVLTSFPKIATDSLKLV